MHAVRGVADQREAMRNDRRWAQELERKAGRRRDAGKLAANATTRLRHALR
jgi:hypothetical protein